MGTKEKTMAKSSINLQKASRGGVHHNDRSEEVEPDYLLPKQYRQKNEFDQSGEEAKKRIEELYETSNENYKKIHNQRLQAKSYLWEAVVNLNKNHTLKDVKKMVKAIEKETGLTSVQIAIHRDEGRVEKKSVVFMCGEDADKEMREDRALFTFHL